MLSEHEPSAQGSIPPLAVQDFELLVCRICLVCQTLFVTMFALPSSDRCRIQRDHGYLLIRDLVESVAFNDPRQFPNTDLEILSFNTVTGPSRYQR